MSAFKPPRPSPLSHNYQKKIAALIASGQIAREPGVTHVNIKHDRWCQVMNGGAVCNCDPDIETYPDTPPAETN